MLGTENPLAALIALAHQHGAKVLVDGARAVMHHPVDVRALGCDFMFSPPTSCTGRPGSACSTPGPSCCRRWRLGKGRVDDRHRQPDGGHHGIRRRGALRPARRIPGIIGLGAALTYVSQLGLTQIAEYEQTLMRYALDALRAVPDLILYGPAQRKG